MVKIRCTLDTKQFEQALKQMKKESKSSKKQFVVNATNQMHNLVYVALGISGGGKLVTSRNGKTYVYGGIPSAAPNPPHRQSGSLQSSVEIQMFNNGYRGQVLVNSEYAAVHEYGLAIRNRGGGTTHMPKRPFFEPNFRKVLNSSTSLLRWQNG